MGIDVAIVNERHEAEQEVLDPQQYLKSLAIDQWHRLQGSICPRFVDPWGDTVFNQDQLPVLLAELEQSMQKQADLEVTGHLAKIVRMVGSAKDIPHTYVKFIGD